MKITIEKELLNQAMLETHRAFVKSPLKIMDVYFINTVWEEYRKRLKQVKEDRKQININIFMEIPGVYGVELLHEENKIKLRTDKGYKIYKTGKVTMDTLTKRIKHFLQ